jgi:hypothetical protein
VAALGGMDSQAWYVEELVALLVVPLKQGPFARPTANAILIKSRLNPPRINTEDSMLSFPVLRKHKPGDIWPALVRSTVRFIKRDGKGYKAIFKKTSISKLIVRRICKSKSSRTTHKGKEFKPKLLKPGDFSAFSASSEL